MSDISVVPDALRSYGAAMGSVSAAVASTGAFDTAGNLAAMTPVFGLIGQDFLAAFAVAQANHAQNYADLATLFGHHARLAHQSAAGYESTDGQTRHRLGSINAALGDLA
jgi:hypothetical protein